MFASNLQFFEKSLVVSLNCCFLIKVVPLASMVRIALSHVLLTAVTAVYFRDSAKDIVVPVLVALLAISIKGVSYFVISEGSYL